MITHSDILIRAAKNGAPINPRELDAAIDFADMMRGNRGDFLFEELREQNAKRWRRHRLSAAAWFFGFAAILFYLVYHIVMAFMVAAEMGMQL